LTVILDKGEIVEFDTPLNLIEREGGVFRQMCLKSGTFDELKTAAVAKRQLIGEPIVRARTD
jgi:hypothetical protein